MNQEIYIINAEYLKEYCIKLTFSDKKIQIVDFKPFLTRASHPEIKKYLDKNLFKQFIIVDGNLDWNDYDPCFPIYDLYENSLIKDFEKKSNAA